MKLFTKYNRINLMAMTIVFIFSGIIYYMLISSVLISELDEALGEYEKRVEKYVNEYDSLPVLKNFEEVEVEYQPVKKYAKRGYSSVERFDPEEQKIGAYRQLVFYQKIKDKLYEIKVAKPVEGTTLLTNAIAYSTIGMILLIILISILLNQFILKRLWRPFYTTMQEMKGFKLGEDTMPRLPETEIEEFSLMNYSLSEVIYSAKDDYRILKEFTENASHEMLTPLATIRSKLDLVIQDEGLSENQSSALKSAYTGIHRLTRLNQSLLLLAKIENKQFAEVEQIDLKEKLDGKISQFHELWSAGGVSVVSAIEHASIIANPELIDVLLNNLFSNAGRHNFEGGKISISLKEGELVISNSANGNPLEESKIFSRFYKENPSSQNNGLGLAIVKQITERSGIKIKYGFGDDLHIFNLSW
jgi:signal transduction histidine kinase